jgi:hypothetical protein
MAISPFCVLLFGCATGPGEPADISGTYSVSCAGPHTLVMLNGAAIQVDSYAANNALAATSVRDSMTGTPNVSFDLSGRTPGPDGYSFSSHWNLWMDRDGATGDVTAPPSGAAGPFVCASLTASHTD